MILVNAIKMGVEIGKMSKIGANRGNRLFQAS